MEGGEGDGRFDGLIFYVYYYFLCGFLLLGRIKYYGYTMGMVGYDNGILTQLVQLTKKKDGGSE